MNRNTYSFDGAQLRVDAPRSVLPLNFSVKTTFNTGDIIPFMFQNVLPGDTHNINTEKLVRLTTPLTPFMDSLFLDTYYFFVPARLLWSHWKNFMGENTESAYLPSTEYYIPQVTAPATTGWTVGTIADYLGIPTGVPGLSVNALLFRAYALIVDQWFRDQNIQPPIVIPTTDTTVTGTNGGSTVNDIAKGGLPAKACKTHDYFTSCLPSPQKGPEVGISLAGTAPVKGTGVPIGITNGTTNAGIGSNAGVLTMYSSLYNGSVSSTLSGTGLITGNIGVTTNGANSGMVADLASASAIKINDLRMSIAIQHFFEANSRGGTRYQEGIKAHFGVTSPDSRIQRPEYLGGNRIPLNVSQVVQVSPDASSPMGDTAAVSVTRDGNFDFEKSFTEHGYIIGLMVARYDHTYQQGLEKEFTRKDMFDFYFPEFANIGETAVLNKEIYAQGSTVDDEVFGYQEAYADYRYRPNRVTGQMRSTYAQSLDCWHLGDEYSAKPTLSDLWIREDPNTVDRVLTVNHNTAHQLMADIYIQNRAIRPMPVHSIPGLSRL